LEERKVQHCPLIGILVPKKKDRINALKLYQHHYDLNMKVCAFTPADIFWRKQRIIGVYRTRDAWKEETLPFPDAVYNRCYKKTTNIAHSVESIIGHKCFNTITHFNKWVIYNLLKKSQLKAYLPDTFLYDQSKFSNILEQFKLLYIKPVYGNKGKKVYRIELVENGDTLISSHSLAPRYICRKNEDIQGKLAEIMGQKQQYIMQKGIRSSQVEDCYYDLRVLVQKDIYGKWTISAIASRIAYDDFFNTAIFKAIYDAEIYLPQLFPLKETGETLLQILKDVSIKAAGLLDYHLGLLGELSVDFILDENSNLWIIEINGKPQKSIYKNIEGFRYEELIYQRPLEYAYYLSQS